MLLQLGRLSHDPRGFFTLFIALVIAFIIGIAFHEFSHALSAYLLGDTTAQSMGRLTLNPIAHLDPAGTVLLLLAGFGWGKPTPVNPYKLRNGPKAGMAIVSAAGPISNFLMAFLFSLPLKFGNLQFGRVRFDGTYINWNLGNYAALLLFYVVFINVVLGLFNLLPIAPLDGAKIASGIFPGELGAFFRRMEPYGPGILMVLFALSWLSPQLSVFNRVIGPLETDILRILGVPV
ncbi:MAG: site-2 protease family protein [Dehalococcoidia bacterium]